MRSATAGASSSSSTAPGSACSAFSARRRAAAAGSRRSTRSSSARSFRSRPAPAPMRRMATWWRSRWRRAAAAMASPSARVTERLGSLTTERAVSLIAIHAHSIPHVFPAAALRRSGSRQAGDARRPRGLARAAARHHRSGRRQGPRRRRARRARRRSRTIAGGFVISVAIADVAHYVRPGSALDREALVRGNSVYFPDRVVPMLPERISNDLCSLRPGEDRAALARAHRGRRRRPQALPQLPSRADALGRQAQLRAGAGRDRRLAGRNHRPAAGLRARAALLRLSRARSAPATSARRSISTCRNARSCSPPTTPSIA